MGSTRYFDKGLPHVQGWLDKFSAKVITSLSNVQRSQGLAGSVGEIGVHHGKLFLLLHENSDPGAKSIAIDVFDEQHLNIDNSGHGDKARFLANLERWSDRPQDVEILQTSSLILAPEDIVGRVGNLRLSSVDGGHTAQCAESDLRLIESASETYGIVIIDDYFNPMWPDVSTGTAAYCLDESTKFRPFAVSPGKVYLASVEYGGLYREELQRRYPHSLDVDQEMFGTQVGVFGIRHAEHPVKESLRYTPVFPLLKRLKSKLD